MIREVGPVSLASIASQTAIFGATFLKIGLIPGDGGAWLLPRVIGMARASELLYTGDTIDAATALQWGLVSKVVPPELLKEEALKLAQRMAATYVWSNIHQFGRMAPDGLRYVSSWVDEDLSTCYQVMETDDPAQLEQWMANWNDLVDFEVHPVMTSEQAVDRIGPRL